MADGNDELGPEFFEEMVEAVGVGVAIYGSDGVFRYVNRAYADLLGADRAALVGTAVPTVVPSLEADRFEAYWASFDDGDTRTAETVHEYGGTSVPVTTITTRRRIDGMPYHFGTISDRTARRARERELERQNERLEAFASLVSHDLRNPLGVAQGYLDLAREDRDSEELEMVASALRRMELLIDDLLTLAREGRSIGEVDTVSVADAASDAWANVSAPGASLVVEDPPTVRADEGRLQQLLENLFRNSVEHGSTGSAAEPHDAVEHGSTGDEGSRSDPGATDAGDAGGVTVRVGALTAESGFYVADDGPGIPADAREDVFEPGYSTSDTGTGFGLAIVAEIADAHGWRVRCTEAADGGARFEFVFDGDGSPRAA